MLRLTAGYGSGAEVVGLIRPKPAESMTHNCSCLLSKIAQTTWPVNICCDQVRDFSPRVNLLQMFGRRDRLG